VLAIAVGVVLPLLSPTTAVAAVHAAPPVALLGIHLPSLSGLLGIHLPSIGDIVRAIVNLFFGTLASALVPGFLRHATVAVIGHLVAVPDPASWPNVGRLQGDMVYLAASLLPVMLTVAVVRFWVAGLTGAAHPAGAVVRAVAAAFALVLYPWGCGQLVAAVNVLTHAILGFPAVSDGLSRMVGVMFGGALLAGVGGVFGAVLVIVGVVFAAALYAAQVLVLLAFALLFVTGPPLIALAVLPETAHLARTWSHVLLGIAMVPVGWTILFATAGALTLDATNFTGGTGGLPSNFAAAFAALITFVLAVRLPLIVLGEVRNIARASTVHASARTATAPSQSVLSTRMVAARDRLRRGTFDGGLSLGRSAGAAAGALGAPRGGPLGVAARATRRVARRTGISHAAPEAAFAVAGVATGAAVRLGRTHAGRSRPGRVLAGRVMRAGAILASAPRLARAAAMGRPTRTPTVSPGHESANVSPRPVGRPDAPAKPGSPDRRAVPPAPSPPQRGRREPRNPGRRPAAKPSTAAAAPVRATVAATPANATSRGTHPPVQPGSPPAPAVLPTPPAAPVPPTPPAPTPPAATTRVGPAPAPPVPRGPAVTPRSAGHRRRQS
jgi:hypothetical protein